MYDSDKASFSDCSTVYEVLPELVADNAGNAELVALAKKHGIALGEVVTMPENKGWKRPKISHAIATLETKEKRFSSYDKPEKMLVYIGFINLSDGPLIAMESIGNLITLDMASEIINNQAYGISEVGENIDGNQCLVKSGWNYENDMRLLGYDRESFESVLDIKDIGFYDDTSRCGECLTLSHFMPPFSFRPYQ